MYMMSDAQTALLSFPRFASVRVSRSLMTWTRNRFSVSSPAQSRHDQHKQAIVWRSSKPTHSSRNRSDSPAQGIQLLPSPLAVIKLCPTRCVSSGTRRKEISGTCLLRQLSHHDSLRVHHIQMSQVDQDRSHRLVQGERVRILHKLPDYLILLIGDNQDLHIPAISNVSTSTTTLHNSPLQASPSSKSSPNATATRSRYTTPS